MGFLDSKIKEVGNGRQVLAMPNSVNFAIMTQDSKILLSRQFRASTNSQTLNLFGGYIDEGEGMQQTLIRELKEETNLDFDDIMLFIPIYEKKYVSMGYTTERNSLYLLLTKQNYSDLSGKLKCNDEDENIEFYCCDVSDIEKVSSEIHSLKFFAFENYILANYMQSDYIYKMLEKMIICFINDDTKKEIVFNFSRIDYVERILRELTHVSFDYDEIVYDGLNVYLDSFDDGAGRYFTLWNDGSCMRITKELS